MNSVIFLSRKITSTAKAYQRCGAHAKASQALDRAGVHITRALQEGGFDERTGESVLYLHCEILYHKVLPLLSPDTTEEGIAPRFLPLWPPLIALTFLFIELCRCRTQGLNLCPLHLCLFRSKSSRRSTRSRASAERQRSPSRSQGSW